MSQARKDPSPLTVTHRDQSSTSLGSKGHLSLTVLLNLLRSLCMGELSAHGAH